jgi:hypothetical protein
MHVDDCVEGIYRIMHSDYPHRSNLGTDELVTVNGLVDLVAEIADKRITKRHRSLHAARGAGRNSDTADSARYSIGSPDPLRRFSTYLLLDRIGTQDRRKGPPARLERRTPHICYIVWVRVKDNAAGRELCREQIPPRVAPGNQASSVILEPYPKTSAV